jgi:hypothetical protein
MPPTATFIERLRQTQHMRRSTLAITLAPTFEKMPYPLLRHDDPFLPYSRAVIDATVDITCAYIFDLAAYLCVGASGAIALERAIAYVPGPTLKILHGPFSRADYARLISDSAFAADAATLDTVDPAVIAAFTADPTRGVFIDTHLANGSLSEPHLAQVGRYQAGESLTLDDIGGSSITSPTIYWEWCGDEVAVASRGDDFRDAIRIAALGHQVAP